MDRGNKVKVDPRRQLPSVDKLSAELIELTKDFPEWCAVEGARYGLEIARNVLEDGGPMPDFRAEAYRQAQVLAIPHPRRVVNATGVVLHTNLGRAPLSADVAHEASIIAGHYSDLEFDLEQGVRGDRHGRLGDLLCALSGAEAGLAVNNNAAAVLLAVNTLAQGREVIVSRGELVEIGGSFRVPEILRQAGVQLVEVGTTNRTHAQDYRDAIGADTGLLLKVHPSNFEQRGFVKEVSLPQLVEIGKSSGIPVVEDFGSGTLVDLRGKGLPEDAYVPSRIRYGVDLLCFSGDKLLGGPQAGLILGRREMVARARRNPLARALRLDKLCIAALDRTLRILLEGAGPDRIPTLRQLLEPLDRLEKKACELRDSLVQIANGRIDIDLERDSSPVGGGSLPGFELPSWAVSLHGGLEPNELSLGFRNSKVPVLSRIREDRVQLDVRTLLPGEDMICSDALKEIL